MKIVMKRTIMKMKLMTMTMLLKMLTMMLKMMLMWRNFLMGIEFAVYSVDDIFLCQKQ